MSVTSTGNLQSLHIKPDKNSTTTLPTVISNASDNTQPVLPTSPINQTSQEADTESLIVNQHSESEDSADIKLENAVNTLNSYMSAMSRDLEFEYDKDIGQTIVTIRDTNSREVVRVIPSEIALKLAKNLQERMDNSEEPLGQLLDITT